MGIQINGQTDTVTSTTAGGSVTLPSATLPSVSNISAIRLNVTGVSTFTTGPVLIGSGTSTGTASQPLQVTGGAYVSGSLGVGVTNPGQLLEVAGSAYVTGGISGQGAYIYRDGGTGGAAYSSQSGDVLITTPGGSQNIRFTTGGQERARINNSGNVLIGTVSSTGTASQPLQVTGGAYVSGNLGVGVTNTAKSIDVQSGATSIIQLGRASSYGDIGGVEFNTSRSFIYSTVQSGTAYGDTFLTFGTQYNNATAERMRLSREGYLGIGTANPTSTLTVGGDIELLTNTPGSINEGGQVILRSAPSAGGTKYRMNIDNYYGATGTSSNVYAFRFFREDDATAANGAVLASLDASGRWRVPSQPAFDAVYTTPNGSTGTQTTNTEIVFNVANTNTGSYFSTSTGRFTAPVAGTYFFAMFGMSEINAAVWYDIRKNGNLITYPHNPYTSTSSPAFRSVGFSVILTLAVNDYVSVFTAGTACGMYGGGNNHNGFCGYLIG